MKSAGGIWEASTPSVEGLPTFSHSCYVLTLKATIIVTAIARG